MSINTGRNQLQAISKDLINHWGQTKNFWNDRRSREFERFFITPVQPTVNAALEAAEQLAKMLAKIRSDCG